MAYTDAKAIFCFSPPDSSKMLRPRSELMCKASTVSSNRLCSSSGGTASFSIPKAISLSVSTLKNCVRGFWKTLPTREESWYIGTPKMLLRSTAMVPFNSPEKNPGIKPLIRRVIVVFPHPERPQSRTHSPLLTVKVKSLSPPSVSSV